MPEVHYEVRPVTRFEIVERGYRRGVLLDAGDVGQAMDRSRVYLADVNGGVAHILNETGKEVAAVVVQSKSAALQGATKGQQHD